MDKPESWIMANVALIPKENKDRTIISNYRPIVLLNIDYKIYTGILAKRLRNILIKYINEDQNGFVPGRHIRNNIRTILNIIEHYSIHNEKKMALILLDAEKAFDNIRWKFMFEILKNMGIGDNFLTIIKQLYSQQRIQIILNGEKTGNIEVQKGTKQGCPLSPLIFIIVLEVLNNSIRSNEKIKGTRFRGHEYKLRAYADDMVLILDDPSRSIENVMFELNEFGNLSGFKINKDKTLMITKNIRKEEERELMSKSAIKIEKKVRYLGIWLTNSNINLFQDNYKRIWSDI